MRYLELDENNNIIGVHSESYEHMKMVELEEMETDILGKALIDGKIVDRVLNDEEVLEQKINEALIYLASTDFKMTSDYDQDVSEVKIKRAQARAFLREHVDGS